MDKKITMNQTVACYMLSLERYSISAECFRNYVTSISKRLNKGTDRYIVDCGDLREITQKEDSIFEESENGVYLKIGLGRKELLDIVAKMPDYAIISIFKNENLEEEDICSI